MSRKVLLSEFQVRKPEVEGVVPVRPLKDSCELRLQVNDLFQLVTELLFEQNVLSQRVLNMEDVSI